MVEKVYSHLGTMRHQGIGLGASAVPCGERKTGSEQTARLRAAHETDAEEGDMKSRHDCAVSLR